MLRERLLQSTLLLTLLLHAPTQAAVAADEARGAALFDGREPLRGRIDGHVDLLPAAVLACVNCHGATGLGSAAVAPDLRGGWLHRAIARRNGPPGHYDAASLCTALRSGIDPVRIRIPLKMPRFEIDDDDCRALWTYLEVAEPNAS